MEGITVVTEKFEERFIYRVGRALPIIIAVLCVLSLLAAGAVIGYSFTPVAPTVAPKPAAVLLEVSLSAQEVGTEVDEIDVQQTDTDGANEDREPSAPQASEAALSIARAIHSIVVLVPGSAWKSSYKTVCTRRYYGICIDSERRLVQEGLSPAIEPVLALYDSDATELEDVKLLEVGASYPVNESNHATKVKVLNEARDILSGQPEGQRRKYLWAWSQLRTEREQARREAIAAEEARVADERQKEELRFATETTKKAAARATAITAGGAALGALWIVALSLALLAIERHLRAVSSRVEKTRRPPD